MLVFLRAGRSKCRNMRYRFLVLPLIFCSHLCMDAGAGEVSVFFGSGPQTGAKQRNNIAGIERTFYTLERSGRSEAFVSGCKVLRWESG